MIINISQELARPYFSKKIIDKYKIKNNYNFFEIGKLYSLQGKSCEDFKMPIKVYKLISIVKKINNINLNSIVVKEVTENNRSIFSLTKLDCELLRIPFQIGLELYPMSLDWKLVDEKKIDTNNFDMKYFSSVDLSTYPKKYENIEKIIVEINWVEFFTKNSISLNYNANPYDVSFNYTNKFKDALRKNMLYSYIKSKIVTKNISENPNPYNDLIDLKGNVYFELLFLFRNNENKKFIGIIPELIKNKTLFDIIQINVSNNEKKEKYNEHIKSIINNTIYFNSSLGYITRDYFIDKNRGRRELWVNNGDYIYKIP